MMGQQRYAYYPPTPMQHNTLLHEGALDLVGMENETNLSSAAPSDADFIVSTTLTAGAEVDSGFASSSVPTSIAARNNKLLSHESVNLLVMLSMAFGALFLFFTFIKQKGKIGGHSYLPRPN